MPMFHAALLTRTSSRPKCAAADATTSSGIVALDWSRWTAQAREPADSTSATVRSARSFSPT
jgi:hypothetical protein